LPVLHRGTLVRRKLLFVIRPVNSRGILAAKRQREHLLHTSVILGAARVRMRKVDGWPTLTSKPIDQPIDLAT
jgi:hypothetical protein